MTDTPPYPVLLARDIARKLDQLAEHLHQAQPERAAQIMEPVLDSDTGILGRVSALLATAATYAKDRTGGGSCSQELWQDLARAANTLHDLGLDLEDQAEEFHLLTDTPARAAPDRPRAPTVPATPTGPGPARRQR